MQAFRHKQSWTNKGLDLVLAIYPKVVMLLKTTNIDVMMALRKVFTLHLVDVEIFHRIKIFFYLQVVLDKKSEDHQLLRYFSLEPLLCLYIYVFSLCMSVL